MKTVGIIAEYNPFHNGHLYHLQQAKRLCDADFAVCVMSGNFIQRGEPAIVDKWARTEMALKNGIDLVLELPVVYAMSSAEFFAHAGVRILDSLGIVDYLCFGSESGNMEKLDALAQVLHDEPDAYRSALKEHLDEGLSYPSARQMALESFFRKKTASCLSFETVIDRPNNILGIEYLKALKKLKSNMKPVTVARAGSEYNAEELSGKTASATAIRKAIGSGMNLDSGAAIIPAEALPQNSIEILEREFRLGRGPVFMESFTSVLLANLRQMSPVEIKALPYVSEGLENRIKAAAGSSGTLDELLDAVCTRRYTRTRIQRILFSLLTGLKALDLERFAGSGGPRYIRVLGFNARGRRLLSMVRDRTSLPVIVKTAGYKSSPDPLLKRMLGIESQAADMYVLGYPNPEHRKAGSEFTRNIIRID